MKSIIHRSLSGILSLLLLFGLCTNITTPVSAATNDIEDLEIIAQKTSECLVNHSINFEYLGLENLDLSCLYLSEAIPTYEYVNGALVPLGIYYYPILEDGSVAALSLVYEADGELLTQLSTSLVDEINSFLTSSPKIALIFDATSLYATDGNNLTKLLDSSCENTWRDTINASGARSISNMDADSFLANVAPRNISEAIELKCDVMPMDAPVSHILDVPYVANVTKDEITDGQTGICWACCVASIGTFLNYKSDYVDGQSVSMWLHGDFKGAELVDVIRCLKGIYDVSYLGKSNAVLHFYNTIVDSTYAGYPVYGVMDTSKPRVYHAIVFTGFWTNSTTKYLYVMDPNAKGTHMATESSAGGIFYVSADNGDRMELLQAAYNK